MIVTPFVNILLFVFIKECLHYEINIRLLIIINSCLYLYTLFTFIFLLLYLVN